MSNNRVNEVPSESVLTIIQRADDGSNLRVVKCPLPDGFGMSVGSSFSDPQNMDLAASLGGGGQFAQIAGKVAGAAGRATGVSTKMTQRSNTFYDGPEPTEISFEMRFNAFYSAYDEVVIPSAKLMMMSVGRETSLAEMRETVAPDLVDEEIVESSAYGFLGSFGSIQVSGECTVRFGKTMIIPRAYVSSCGVQFSNVLDNQGYPMSSTCSVTIKVIKNPTQNEIGGKYFTGGGIL